MPRSIPNYGAKPGSKTPIRVPGVKKRKKGECHHMRLTNGLEFSLRYKAKALDHKIPASKKILVCTDCYRYW